MKIAIGNDRRGYEYKKRLMEWLNGLGHDVINVGSDNDNPVDYPVFAYSVGKRVASQECDRGILICSSGIGMSIAANKVRGIRCGMAYNLDVATKMREHNDANIIAIGQDYMPYDEVKKCIDSFLNTDFAGKHHRIRIAQISEIEDGLFEAL